MSAIAAGVAAVSAAAIIIISSLWNPNSIVGDLFYLIMVFVVISLLIFCIIHGIKDAYHAFSS